MSTNPPMVVEVEGLGRDFLERVWKLMLICAKIKRTMHGAARVVIENTPCHFVTIHSEAPIRYLLAMANVKEWHQFQCVWIPSDMLGNLGQCRVAAGMRGSQTIVDQNALWFQGSDGTINHFVSARLSRDWVRQMLNL